MRVNVEALSTRFETTDEKWSRQADDLYHELLANVPNAKLHEVSRPGTKGTVTELIIALGGAQFVAELGRCFRAWLGRDRDRTIRLRIVDGDQERSITITGETVSDEAIRDALRVSAQDQRGDA